MIKGFELQGFQGWDTVSCSLGMVNIFIGDSDVGKSSIVRALKWNFSNRPQGDKFRNEFFEEEDVVFSAVDFEEDSFIVRERSKKLNQYLISGIEKPLKALRTDVPDEVKQLSRMKDFNIQTQHPNDQYFLLIDKPGAVAKKFNIVSGISITDKVTKITNQRVSLAKSQLSYFSDKIETKEGELKESKWVPIALKQIKAIQIERNKLFDLEEELYALTELVSKYKRFEEELELRSWIKNAYQDIENLILLAIRTKVIKNELNYLLTAVSEQQNLSFKINACAYIDSMLIEIKSIKELVTKKDTYWKEKDVLVRKVKKFKKWSTRQKDISFLIEEGEKVIAKALHDNPCPLCGRL